MLHWWSIVRWFMVVVLFSIGLLHINFADTPIESIVFLGVFVGVVCLNLLFKLQTKFNRYGLMLFQVVLDVLFATIVVHITGGLNSYFVWVYLIAVITASLTIPRIGGIFAGLTGSFSLMMLIVLYQNGIIEPTETSALDATGSIIYILSYTGLFSGVAFITAYLNDNCDKNEKLKGEIESLSEKLETQNLALAEEKRRSEKLKTMMPLLKDVEQIRHDINTPLCVITLSLGRVKRLGIELANEGLQKTNNEITESVNKINGILLRLDPLYDLINSIENKEVQQ